MKKNGWGLSTMIIFCSIIAFCLIFSIVMYKLYIEPSIARKTEDKPKEYNIVNKTYIGLEEDVALFSKDYFKSNDKDLVTLKTLVEEGFMESIYDLKDKSIKCSGYVTYKEHSYHTYLKCGNNYETSGYVKDLDN